MQRISELMTPDVWTIASTASIREAAKLMADRNVGFLPVIHESTSAGVVTDRDIVVRAIAENLDPDATCVGAILSTDRHPRHGGADDITAGIASLIEDTPVDVATQFMDERGIRRVAVHDRDFRLVGVVSRSDLPVSAEATQRP
jgi:CBS domain-containing protein